MEEKDAKIDESKLLSLLGIGKHGTNFKLLRYILKFHLGKYFNFVHEQNGKV